MACGATTVRACPKVNLTRTTTAAIMRRHGGHPVATLSSFFERQATSLFQGPSFCISTPFAIKKISTLFLINIQGEGLSHVWETEGWGGQQGSLDLVERPLFFVPPPQVKGIFALVRKYRGATISVNPGIHSLQKPALPRNAHTSLAPLGGRSRATVCLQPSVSHR